MPPPSALFPIIPVWLCCRWRNASALSLDKCDLFDLPLPLPLFLIVPTVPPTMSAEHSALQNIGMPVFHPRGFPAHTTAASPAASRSPSPTSAHDVLTLRALVTTKEAGVIIGKGGKNVADLREQTGVRAGVSKVTPGVHERVLTVGGSVEAIAKVRSSISPASSHPSLSPPGIQLHHHPTRLIHSLSRFPLLISPTHLYPPPYLT